MQNQRLFIYGTLMRGEVNHSWMMGARWLGVGCTEACYRLHVGTASLGPYPALVDGGTRRVLGELYEITPQLRAVLDDFEGHPNLYMRRPVWVRAWHDVEAYFLANPAAHAGQEIVSGDWRAYRCGASG